jgi:hypothetical protein
VRKRLHQKHNEVVNPLTKSFVLDHSAELHSIKERSSSIVAQYRKKSKTLFGHDVAGGYGNGE